jgi:hypothetical protein
MKTFLITVLFTCWAVIVFSQEPHSAAAMIMDDNGDTLYVINLPQLNVIGKPYYKNARAERRYGRLVRNVIKVYPYAVIAREKLEEYSTELAGVTDEKEKKRILRQAEQDMMDRYGNELKDLNFTQGTILIKLVDRETGSSSYELVRELRGQFIAFFWQSLARIFGYNLKVRYDPQGEDRDIEMIVQMIEKGEL